MSIRDIIKHIDSKTENDTFDITKVNYIQSAHPNLTNSDRKELKRHISKYTEFGVKSQVKHTTIRQKVYKKNSPQNVQVNE